MNQENLPFEFMSFEEQRISSAFHAKDLSQTESLRRYAEHAVMEIKSAYGWETDVQIKIEPEAKDKQVFSVSMTVLGMDEPIVVRKDGKHVMSVLRKVRKAVMRQIHRLNEKRISARRKHFFRTAKRERSDFHGHDMAMAA